MEWEEILQIIGAKKSTWRLIPFELDEISTKMMSGELLTKEEIQKLKNIWQSKEPLADQNGNPFVLYIYDRSTSIWNKFESKYKFHFKWCHTLENMDKDGRRGRYKAKYDIENPVFDSSYKRKETLDVCLNCINNFNFNNKIRPTVSEFTMKEFFDTYGIQNLKYPTHQYHTHTYTNDWPTTAKEYKQSKNWRCEMCNKNFSSKRKLLHAHHINGVKDDNSPSNLKSLCYECHSKEPAHAFLRKL